MTSRNLIRSWPACADFDGDGWVDVALSTEGSNTNALVTQLYRATGQGTFTRSELGSAMRLEDANACVWADYDNDGFMDLLLTRGGVGLSNRRYHNLKKANHWLKLNLTGTVSNRDALGAKVRVLATIRGQAVWQMRKLSGGFVQDDPRPNFGLGDATVAERVIIEWPSGNVQEVTSQPANRLLTLTEPIRIEPVRPSASLGGSVTMTNLSVGSQWTYQWKLNGVELAGQTNRTLSVTNVQLAQQGRYSIGVTTAIGITITNCTYLLVDTQFRKITEGPIVYDPVAHLTAAWADYDGDGDPDLVIGSGWFIEGQNNDLYRNDGGGTFTRITEGPLVESTDKSCWGMVGSRW